MPKLDTLELYDMATALCREVVEEKDHDYGQAWVDARVTSVTDIILFKAKRIKRLEILAESGIKPRVSEGISSEYRDIANWCKLALILMGLRGDGPLDELLDIGTEYYD
jgi:hypothetical protein